MRPAIQLYSLRDLDEPLDAVVRRVADAGFEGVEFATRLTDDNAPAVADALADTGLDPIGAHVPFRALDVDDNDLDALLARYDVVGCRELVVPHLPMAHYRTRRRVRALAARLDAVGERLADRGFRFAYHNPVSYPQMLLPVLTD